MDTQIHARKLHDKYGWNVVPMYFFQRDMETGVKKVKLIEWQKYKAEPYPLDKWLDSYTALSIITGQISNLTVLDIDSQEGVDTLLDHLAVESVTDLAGYVVKTFKGYQLFYSYEPNTTTRIGIKDKMDFLNGGITFAVDTNESYTTIKDDKPYPMPDALKKLILDKEEPISNDVKAFERALRENSDLPYRRPLQPLIKEFVDAKRVSTKLKSSLEKVFCSGKYRDYTLKDFTKEGQINELWLYVGSIVSSNPTVSKELFYDFMEAWREKILKVEIKSAEPVRRYKSLIKSCLKLFRYDSEWKNKSEDLNNVAVVASKLDRKVWRDLEGEKYVIFDPNSKRLLKLSRPMFKEELVNKHNAKNPEDPITPESIDTTKLPEAYETFDPTVNDRFFQNEYGEEMFNHFERSPLLKHFQTCTPRAELPEFLGNVINHVYPDQEERDMFLHTLAYHMTYLQASPTCYILTGKSGTGKNIILQQVLSEIYGNMFLPTTANSLTGRFRNQLKNKLLVFIDEVNEKRHKDTAQGSLHNVIKQIVANKSIEIEAKGKDTESYPNHSLVVMASNQKHPIRLEEGFDRRINITETRSENLQTLKWFPHHLSREERDQLIKEETTQFVEYLASLELDKAKWDSTIDNEHRKGLIYNSIPIVDQYVTAIIEKDYDILHDINIDFAEWFESQADKSSIPTSDLKYQIGDIGARVIKKLQEAGVQKKKVNNKWSLVLNPQGTDKPFASVEGV